MRNHFNPHHPMRHLISVVAETLLRDDPEYQESPATLPPVIRRMYQEFLRFPEHGSRTPSLVDLLHHLKRLDASYPSEGDLEGAPELCRWALVRRPASEFCQLTGYAAAHPRFEWGGTYCHFIGVPGGQGIPMGTHLEPVLLALRICPANTAPDASRWIDQQRCRAG